MDEDSVLSDMDRVGNELADLRRRLTALEAEQARQLSSPTQTEDEVTPLEAAGPSASAELAIGLLQEQFSPAYVARAVVALESHLADMERFAATANEGAARQSKLAATMRLRDPADALRR